MPSIAKNNIQGELKVQLSWVPPPKDSSRKHFFSIPGERGTQFTWRVLDCDLLEPELLEILELVWRMELERAGVPSETMADPDDPPPF